MEVGAGVETSEATDGEGVACSRRCLLPLADLELANCDTKSMGTGKMIVEFFSAAIEFKV